MSKYKLELIFEASSLSGAAASAFIFIDQDVSDISRNTLSFKLEEVND